MKFTIVSWMRQKLPLIVLLGLVMSDSIPIQEVLAADLRVAQVAGEAAEVSHYGLGEFKSKQTFIVFDSFSPNTIGNYLKLSNFNIRMFYVKQINKSLTVWSLN